MTTTLTEKKPSTWWGARHLRAGILFCTQLWIFFFRAVARTWCDSVANLIVVIRNSAIFGYPNYYCWYGKLFSVQEASKLNTHTVLRNCYDRSEPRTIHFCLVLACFAVLYTRAFENEIRQKKFFFVEDVCLVLATWMRCERLKYFDIYLVQWNGIIYICVK